MVRTSHFVQPDVKLSLDRAGVIQSAVLSNMLATEGFDAWVGRPWADTVVEGGNEPVRRMLADAQSAGVSSFCQVRQRFPSGLELTVEYTTVKLGDDAGLIAIGRNLEAVTELRARLLAAQSAMERDYWKLREVETRYRLLFDASTQPVLLVRLDDTRIVEANPVAIRLLGVASGRELLPEILASQREAFRAMLLRVRDQGKSPGIILQLGPDRQPWLMRASLIIADQEPLFVLQLSAAGMGSGLPDRPSVIRLEDLLAHITDGFVVISPEGSILRSNRAFLELIGQNSEAAVLGERLERWLEPCAADADLLASLQQQVAVDGFHAEVKRSDGTRLRVEISAAGDAESKPRFFGLLIRRTKGALGLPLAGDGQLPTHLVGKVPLREIVQTAIAAIERRCIETALALARGNRTMAAETLGMSRQSLYTKLSLYSLDPEG